MKKEADIAYQSVFWKIGTTSFRTKNFNQTIEKQLDLLDAFRRKAEYEGKSWQNNPTLQTAYYDFLKERGFLEGEAVRKDKDARQKTSGLVSLGLLDDDRNLTEAGRHLLKLSRENDFAPDNFLQLDKDSFLYFTQLLKASVLVNGHIVRPFPVLLKMLDLYTYLTYDEMRYLLPFCTDGERFRMIADSIREVREGRKTIDDIILDILLGEANYRQALRHFLEGEVTPELVCTIGLNRKSKQYDNVYFYLYGYIRSVFLDNRTDDIGKLFDFLFKLKLHRYWKKYLFAENASPAAIAKRGRACLSASAFTGVTDEQTLKLQFFKTLHLQKCKATLADYFDLNRRYFSLADVLVYDEEQIRLDIFPKHYLASGMDGLFDMAFSASPDLGRFTMPEEICPALHFNEKELLSRIGQEIQLPVRNIREARASVERAKYARLHNLIARKFDNKTLLKILGALQLRKDKEVQKLVTDNADIPTIFEYVLGLVWYILSNKEGKLLSYLKLSLDSNLLPKSHAVGGEADIVYEYEESAHYPAHTLLVEATLSEGCAQRKMEYEPVTRHLGKRLLSAKERKAYAVFVAGKPDINLMTDFRARKDLPYYDTAGGEDYVVGMKILPLSIEDLKQMLKENLGYPEVYRRMEKAFQDMEPDTRTWYDRCVKF